jgi:hypothetical protein
LVFLSPSFFPSSFLSELAVVTNGVMHHLRPSKMTSRMVLRSKVAFALRMSSFYTESNTTDFNRRLTHFLEKEAGLRPLLTEVLAFSRTKNKKASKKVLQPS